MLMRIIVKLLVSLVTHVDQDVEADCLHHSG